MNKYLVVVESPNKKKTISRYLDGLNGDKFQVEATVGHIRDLSTSGKGGLGLDVLHDFKPKYVLIKGKEKVVENLKKIQKQGYEIVLATDPDREGEAIAWHVADILNLDVKATKRIEFHEITRDSVTHAFDHVRTIDLDLKESQETRRGIDRIVGFKLSKVVYKKVKSKSAGRVQSAVLKLIMDRQKEIDQFVPEEYWTIGGTLKHLTTSLKVNLVKIDDKKAELASKKEADDVLARVGQALTLSTIKKRTKVTPPPLPFNTSSLQQVASSRFGYSLAAISKVTQQLFEGIKIDNEEIGLITYMRTDSTTLSDTFIKRAHNFIREAFGEQYIYAKSKALQKKNTENNAHEAIRPTGNHRTPASIRQYLTPQQFKIYELIYNRAVGSLMPPKEEEITTYNFSSKGLLFTHECQVMTFDGYTKVYQDDKEDDIITEKCLLKEGEVLPVEKIEAKQNFTKGPQKYSVARLVEEMESKGIGRPSTYSTTVSTLKDRRYVDIAKNIITPTEQGARTNTYLELYFEDLINTEFTSKMEKSLDEVHYGDESRLKILSGIYNYLEKKVEKAGDLPEEFKAPLVEHGECPQCHVGTLIERVGRYGKFIGCSRYPDCKYIQKEVKAPPKQVGRNCPQCGHPLVERLVTKGKNKGKTFIGCSQYPKCKYIEGFENNENEKNPL